MQARKRKKTSSAKGWFFFCPFPRCGQLPSPLSERSEGRHCPLAGIFYCLFHRSRTRPSLPFAKPLFPAPNRQANFFLIGPVPAQGCEEQELQNQIKNRLSIPLFPCLPAAEAGKAALFASDSPLHPALAHAFPLLRFEGQNRKRPRLFAEPGP